MWFLARVGEKRLRKTASRKDLGGGAEIRSLGENSSMEGMGPYFVAILKNFS